jgi:hypothetical protein
MHLLHDRREDRAWERVTTVEQQRRRSTAHQAPSSADLAAGSAVTPAPGWVNAALVLVVAVHMVLLFANVLAFLVLPFLAPWYVAVPLTTFLFFFVTTRQECQVTNLENRLRQRLGKRRINGFVGHYFVRPIKRRLWPRPEVATETC